FKVGETWILIAHPKTVSCKSCVGTGMEEAKGGIHEGHPKCSDCHGTGKLPGIFKVWCPSRIEKIVPESSRGSAEVQELLDKGITPVFVPDNDPDHQGTVYDKLSDDVADVREAA